MKSTKRKASTEKYLPPEVLWQVLARLPVKSLLRFRCVSKTWCSEIDDPDFVSMHLELFKNNRDKTHLLVMEGMGSNSGNGRKFSVRSTESLRKTLQLAETRNHYWILGSCNGLVLLEDHEGLRLGNPSVRKSLQLQPCPRVDSKSSTINFNYVFGFAPLTNDYKVVAFETSSRDSELLSMAVYTLKDRVWRTRDVNGIDVPSHVFTVRGGCLFFDGGVHWFTAGPNDPNRFGWNRTQLLTSFDMDTETFSYVQLPGFDIEILIDWCLCLVGESLAAFRISYGHFCIWVLEKNGGETTWRLLCIEKSTAGMVRFFRDDSQGTMFRVGKTGLHFTCEKRSYDFENHQMKLLAKSMNLLSMQPYFESLVLCRGLDGQNQAPFP